MRYWLKVTGTGDSPITDRDWFAVHRRWGQANGHFSGFSKRPNVVPGDRLVTYAAGSGQVFGAPRIYSVEQVTGLPKIGTHPRWTWAVTTEVVVAGPVLTRAPTLHDIEVSTKSVRSHSHIRLSDEQGIQAERLIGDAAAKHGTPYDREVDRRDRATAHTASSALEHSDEGGAERRQRIDAIKASGVRMSLPDLSANLRSRQG